MDRRQRKTRNAIFNALILLLSKKSFDKITVEEIIQKADVGRATFYTHFETKDYLLKGLCAELFDHIFEVEHSNTNEKSLIFCCNTPNTVFIHLFEHFKKNDNNICKLLSCENRELFLQYFRPQLQTLIENHLDYFTVSKPYNIPQSFWINHLTSTFIETLKWWIENGVKESPEIISEYFVSVVSGK